MIAKYKFPNYQDVGDDIYIHYVDNSQRTEEMHTHPFFQIIFMLKGRLTHNINGKSATMSTGEMAIIPPDVPHCVTLVNNPTYYSLSFNLSGFGKINSTNHESLNFLKSIAKLDTNFPKTTIHDEDILHVQSIFERMLKEKLCKQAGYKVAIQSYKLLLITQFMRRYHLPGTYSAQTESYTKEQMILNCINYIEENFMKNICLSDMAHLAAVSESTFCSSFKKITGCTLLTFLNKCRIRYATELIKKGYKITAVSSFCGYDDFSTFSRNFKKHTGISPREFQKNL